MVIGFPIFFFIAIGFLSKGIHEVCSDDNIDSLLNRTIKAESIIAMIRYILVAIFYVIMFFLLQQKLQLKMTCRCTTTEQILFHICLMIIIALIIRVIVRIVFSAAKLDECSLTYLIIYIFKEVLGQFLPIMFAIIADVKKSKSLGDDYSQI